MTVKFIFYHKQSDQRLACYIWDGKKNTKVQFFVCMVNEDNLTICIKKLACLLATANSNKFSREGQNSELQNLELQARIACWEP